MKKMKRKENDKIKIYTNHSTIQPSTHPTIQPSNHPIIQS